jgi:hypothetical protein
MSTTPSCDQSAAEPRWSAFLGTALLVAGLGALLVSPAAMDGDGAERFKSLTALLERGERSSATPYSLVGPLFSTPLWLLGRLALSPEWWCLGYNRLLFFAGLPALWLLLRDIVSPAVLRRFLLLLVFASMFGHHLQHYFGEVFSAVLVAVGLAAVARGRRLGGWAAVVLAVVNTPAALPALALAAAWAAVRDRRWRHLLAVPAAAGLVLLEAYLRRGDPFLSGYEGNHGFATVLPYSGRPGFSYPLGLGLLAVLLSFGKGLVFFAPGLLLPVAADGAARRARGAWQLWLVFLAGLVPVYACWWAWYGGWFWGPRFFLLASVPASFALAANLADAARHSLGRNLLALAAVALSLWVGFNGLVIGQTGLGLCVEDDYRLEFLAWYVPEFSVLWHPLVAPPPLPAEPAVRIALAAVLALYAVCFVYLAGPLAVRCVRQAVDGLRAGWARATGQEPWRF